MSPTRTRTRSSGRELHRSNQAGALEPGFHPFELLGPEWRDDRVFAVVDHAAIRAFVVGPIENGLQRQGNIGIAGQERNGDPRQSLLEPDGIDEEVAGPVEAMDANVVIERSGLLDGQIPRNGRRVRPAAEQVDFDQVGLTGEDLSLLVQVLLAPRVAKSLVGRTEDLDRRRPVDPREPCRRRISTNGSSYGSCSIVSPRRSRARPARLPPRLATPPVPRSQRERLTARMKDIGVRFDWRCE